jgi:hypothetical protein
LGSLSKKRKNLKREVRRFRRFAACCAVCSKEVCEVPFDSRPGQDVISSEEMLKKLLALANEKSYHEKAAKLSLASNMLEGPRRAAEWLEIEMETGTDVFMVGIESHLSWIEKSSLDCYLILSLLAFVLYKAASKLRSRKHKIR